MKTIVDDPEDFLEQNGWAFISPDDVSFCPVMRLKPNRALRSRFRHVESRQSNSVLGGQEEMWRYANSIRSTLINLPPAKSRTAEVYGGFSWSKDCMATSHRADAVLLAHLRAGHTPLLKAYANLLDPSADPLCPLCKEEPQTIEFRSAFIRG